VDRSRDNPIFFEDCRPFPLSGFSGVDRLRPLSRCERTFYSLCGLFPLEAPFFLSTPIRFDVPFNCHAALPPFVSRLGTSPHPFVPPLFFLSTDRVVSGVIVLHRLSPPVDFLMWAWDPFLFQRSALCRNLLASRRVYFFAPW